MKPVSMLAAGAALAALAMVSAAEAQARVEVGVLTCTARGSQGYIIGSSRELRCRSTGRAATNITSGTIDKFGIDIGTTKQAMIAWAVLAPTATCRRARSTAPTAASAPRPLSAWASAPMP